ncbi:PREDICTED: carnitine O-acetyltransferase-like isoform X2 [Acropora digitifera]|uniref:carnitine O-acetyltransferase-like isoform X2 n=2 Tax=Acropora digitifera TaxID=70779 RepID=UPI00077A87CE|nr:PREDICTED: carnitine O-acetyltransferase-like isoform X2 [Acropora digitifera]
MQCVERLHMLSLVARRIPKAQIVKFASPVMVKTSASGVTKPFSMLAKQDSLPPLPVPALQQTMEKYLSAIKPLVDEEEFEYTQDLVKDFLKPNGDGEHLQNKLIQKAKTETNWLATWWDNVAYFEGRSPLVITTSPGLAFPKVSFTDKMDHLKYAARVISTVLKFKELIDSEAIPVDMMGKNPLCMIQYLKLLGSCRIPQPVRDHVVVAPKGMSKHVIVAYKKEFYVLNVYDGSEPLSEGQIAAQLEKIINNSDPEPSEEAVGILTGAERTFWAKQRKRMLKDRKNKANLEAIEGAVFVLCLDQPPPHSTQSPSVMEMPTSSVTARQCLHGDGTQYNSANRWFDKIIQVCVSEDGHSGICYEHSAAEGPPVAALCNYILENLGNHQEVAPSVVQHLETPAKLKWNLTNKLREAIQQSASELDSMIADTDLRCFVYDGYGKDLIKQHKMSPDAWIQIAFQLTFYKIHNHNPPTYETGSTRKFLLGRTDTIRSASIASSNFVKAMVSPNKTNAEKLDLMKKAIKAHTHYTQEAVNGQAIDRHLLGLKLAALESRMNLPELFMDSSYQYALHYKLSTSQVPSNHELFLSFGPAVPDGYGVCYNPQKNKIILGVSTVNSNPETNPGHFAAYLQRSLDEMQLLAKTSKL